MTTKPIGELVSEEVDNILEDDTQGSPLASTQVCSVCVSGCLSGCLSGCVCVCVLSFLSFSYTQIQLHVCTPIHIYVFKKNNSSIIACSAFLTAAIRHYSWLSQFPGAATIISNDILNLFFGLRVLHKTWIWGSFLPYVSVSVWKHICILISPSLREKGSIFFESSTKFPRDNPSSVYDFFIFAIHSDTPCTNPCL